MELHISGSVYVVIQFYPSFQLVQFGIFLCFMHSRPRRTTRRIVASGDEIVFYVHHQKPIRVETCNPVGGGGGGGGGSPPKE